MARLVAWQTTRLAALLGLALSVALLIDTLGPTSRLCGFDSGCGQVQTSAFAHVLGVPLPLIGAAGFAAVFALTLVTGRRAALALGVLVGAAGAAGLALLALQVFVIGQLCPYCVAVDVLAVVAAASHLGWNRLRAAPTPDPSRRWWLAGAAVAVALPLAWGLVEAPTGAPAEVTAHWQPGKVNVVEVADFRCPHCRRMHRLLHEVVRGQEDRVHLVLVTVPMPSHPETRPAVLAHRCAAAQGRGREMADALFDADDITPEACARRAAALGLSPATFRACVDDPALDRRVDADLAWLRQASPHGLPAVWVQDQLLSGEQSADELRAALSRARPQPLPPTTAAGRAGP
jgi:uncharacterized membrane protein/protein-disulfide isomerase